MKTLLKKLLRWLEKDYHPLLGWIILTACQFSIVLAICELPFRPFLCPIDPERMDRNWSALDGMYLDLSRLNSARLVFSIGFLADHLVMAAIVLILLDLPNLVRDGYYDGKNEIGKHITRETALQQVWRYCRGVGVWLLVFPLVIAKDTAKNLVEQSITHPEMREIDRDAARIFSWFAANVAFGFIGIWIGRYILRNFAMRGETRFDWSIRRPVLYLRTFSADSSTDRNPVWNFFWSMASPEQSLARTFADVGPLVALGRPMEKLPPLGAARLYVKDEWQEVVTKLVSASQFVILRAATSESVLWELKELLRCDPGRVAIYIPRRFGAERYGRFREAVNKILPQPLPYSNGSALFIAFDKNWGPQLLGENRWYFFSGIRSYFLAANYAPILRSAIGGHLRRIGLGVYWLPIQMAEWCLVGVGLFFFIKIFVENPWPW